MYTKQNGKESINKQILKFWVESACACRSMHMHGHGGVYECMSTCA